MRKVLETYLMWTTKKGTKEEETGGYGPYIGVVLPSRQLAVGPIAALSGGRSATVGNREFKRGLATNRPCPWR
jgi:hypothetical protein